MADKEEGVDLVGFLTPGVLITLLVVVVVFLAAAAVTGWLLWRRMRRSGVLARGRAAAERGLLTVGVQALPAGPRRDLAALQTQVGRSRAELARQADAASATSGGYLGDLPMVLPQLDADGVRLERALAALVITRDERRIARDQQEFSARAREYIDATDRAIAAIRAAEAAHRGPETTLLYAEVDEAVASLNAYSDAYRELGDGSS
ncbi:hypothetical protein GCM10020255_009290 [Rhodococcus baikonurensis]